MEPVANPSQTAIHELGSQLREGIGSQAGHAVLSAARGLDLSYCFQCGTCSGSCPTADRMEYGPRRIMQMVRLGMDEKVLRSDDPWLCVSCYSCTARCPQGIQVASVMAVLRNLAIVRGMAKNSEATFSQIFTKVVEQYGRLYEPELLLRYYLGGRNLVGLLKQAGLGLDMLRKGKLALRPERVRSAGEWKQVWTNARGDGGRQG